MLELTPSSAGLTGFCALRTFILACKRASERLPRSSTHWSMALVLRPAMTLICHRQNEEEDCEGGSIRPRLFQKFMLSVLSDTHCTWLMPAVAEMWKKEHLASPDYAPQSTFL